MPVHIKLAEKGDMAPGITSAGLPPHAASPATCSWRERRGDETNNARQRMDMPCTTRC